MTLAEFLTARLDEDEAAAREVSRRWPWDPARVLADVAAKRAIVAKWHSLAEQADHPTIGAHCTGVGLTLHLLAQPYSSHPDFDPAWSV